MQKHDITWAAGLFEGEGCICRSKPNGRKAFRGKLRIVMLDEDIVKRFAAIVRCGHVHGPIKHTRSGRADYWKWETSRWRDIVHVIVLLRPHLGVRRQQQLDTVLRTCQPTYTQRVPEELPPDCGYCQPEEITPRGYIMHRKKKTELCRGCYAANLRYRRKRKVGP